MTWTSLKASIINDNNHPDVGVNDLPISVNPSEQKRLETATVNLALVFLHYCIEFNICDDPSEVALDVRFNL